MAEESVPARDWLEDNGLIELESGYDPLLFLSAAIISQAIEDLLAPPFIEENRQSYKMFKFLYLEREKERYDALAFLRSCLRGRNPYITFLSERYPQSRLPFLVRDSINRWRLRSWIEMVKMEVKREWSNL